MPYYYHCSRCGVAVGSIKEQYLTSEQLGLHQLTHGEKRDMVSHTDGHTFIKTICEECQEAVEKNKDWHIDTFIH